MRSTSRLKGIRLFKGTECDILADGRLDYDDDLLATFDYVVASVHSHFNQSREEMTERHRAGGASPGRDDARPRNRPAAAAPRRLRGRSGGGAAGLRPSRRDGRDQRPSRPPRPRLGPLQVRRCFGVRIVVNPDAHSTAELALYRFGIDVARRGWLTRADVFNTRPVRPKSPRRWPNGRPGGSARGERMNRGGGDSATGTPFSE